MSNADTPQPQVSILLPAWNEADHIDACLRALIDLRYPNKQIIVCAGGNDRTLALARAYEERGVLVLAQQPGEGKQRALRRCYGQAIGEVIYLTDADCIVDDAAFESVVGPVIAGAAAATGTLQPLDCQVADPFVQYQWAHHIYRELWMPDNAPTLEGCNAAIARWALDDVGVFNMDASIGTDYVLSKQLTVGGYDIGFVRGSRVQTEYPDTLRAYWKQQSRWFRNPVILGRQWSEWPLVIGVVRAGFLAVLMLTAPAAIPLTRSRRTLLAGWLVGVLHLWLSAARMSAVLAKGQERPGAMATIRILLYLPIGWIAMALGLKDVALSRRRLLW